MLRKDYRTLAALTVLALLVAACGATPTPQATTTIPATGSLADEDAQALLIGLGQIKGHLLASIDLYRAGDSSTAAVHAAHPMREVFGEIAALMLEKPGQADKLKGALDAYLDAINSGRPAADVDKAHADALAAVDETGQSLAFAGRQNTVEFLGPVVLGLLDTVVEEYEEAVVNGHVENTVEYQDAYGFARVVAEWHGLMANDLKARSPEAATKLEGYLGNLEKVFPSVTPPSDPAPAESVEVIAADVRAVLGTIVPTIAHKPEPQPEPEPEPDPAAPTGTEAPIPPGALVIYSGRREPLLQPVLDAFKAEHPEVEIVLKSGDNSPLANALIEEKANPQADLFITTDLFTVQTLYEEGVFENYVSPAAAATPAGYRQADGGWTGLTARARVIMYNTELVKPEEAPQSIFDLTDPKWKGQIASAGSSNGSLQAQAAVMRQLVGEEKTEAWLKGLLDNEVTFFSGHTDVRKAVGAGEFKIGLVNHYYYYLQKAEGSPVGIVFPDQGEGQIGLIVNATAVGMVEGGKNEAAAKALVDFLLSEEGQKLFAELNYEYPLVAGVALHPDVEPLTNFRLATVNLEQAITDREATFDLLEKVGLP